MNGCEGLQLGLGNWERAVGNCVMTVISKLLKACVLGGVLVQVEHHERGSHRSGDFAH